MKLCGPIKNIGAMPIQCKLNGISGHANAITILSLQLAWTRNVMTGFYTVGIWPAAPASTADSSYLPLFPGITGKCITLGRESMLKS